VAVFKVPQSHFSTPHLWVSRGDDSGRKIEGKSLQVKISNPHYYSTAFLPCHSPVFCFYQTSMQKKARGWEKRICTVHQFYPKH
jgi:hypothetical protein